MKATSKPILLACLSFATVALLYSSIFVVETGRLAIVCQLDDTLVRVVTEAGIHVKIPFVQKVHYLPNHRVFELKIDRPFYEPGSSRAQPTAQTVKWRISDAGRYYSNYGSSVEMQEPIARTVEEALRKISGNHRPSNDSMYLAIVEQANALLEYKGIEVLPSCEAEGVEGSKGE